MQIHSSILAWKMDRGAWQATVHGVARADTHTHTHTHTHTLQSMGLRARAHTHTPFKNHPPGNSLAVQWLGVCIFTAEGRGSIPGRGTNITVLCGQKNNKQTKTE